MKMKRIASFALIITILLMNLEEYSVLADTYEGEDYTDCYILAKRLDTLFQEYPPNQSYFTSTAGGKNHSGNKLTPCNRVGYGDAVSGSMNTCGWFDGQFQCFGYALYAQYMIFGKTQKGTLNNEIEGGSSITYTTVSNPTKRQILNMPFGTHIRNNSPAHSVIMLKCDENTITYLDCNCAATWGCAVHLHTTTWTYFFSRYGIGSSAITGYAVYPTADTYPRDVAYGQTPFVDIGDHWAKNDIETAYLDNMISGMTATRFYPNSGMTRAMFVQMIYNADTEKADDGTCSFTDVSEHLWYFKAISWAYGSGVVSGTSESTFEPERLVSREEAVQILYNYFMTTLVIYEAEGIDLEVENEHTDDPSENLSRFMDGDKVANWAREAMAWAIGVEIIVGQSEGMIAPGSTMTRAEAVIVLLKYGW